MIRVLVALSLAATIVSCDLLVDRNGLTGGSASTPCNHQSAALAAKCSQPGWCAFTDPIANLGACAGGRCENLLDLGGGIASCNDFVLWNAGSLHPTNEMYALDFDAGSWQEVRDASPQGTTCSEVLDDGTPRARTVYDGLVFVEHANTMFLFGGEPLDNCPYPADTWTLDLASFQWTQQTTIGSPAGGVPFADYDPVTRSVYLFIVGGNNTTFWQYDYDHATYTMRNGGNTTVGSTARIDPVNHVFLLFGRGQLVGYRLDSSFSFETYPTSGCDAVLMQDAPGVAYDPDRKTFIVWPNGGTTVYELAFDPSGTKCTALTEPVVGGPGPQPSTARSTYGRFRYLPGAKAFMLVDDVSDSTWVLKLAQ